MKVLAKHVKVLAKHVKVLAKHVKVLAKHVKVLANCRMEFESLDLLPFTLFIGTIWFSLLL